MKINRERLVTILQAASVGLSQREVLEQSNAFVFTDSQLVTFNGEILTRRKSPLNGIEGAIPAGEFLGILEKFPDDEVDISLKKGEVIIKGNRRDSGITRMAEVTLPFSGVPEPKAWKPIPEGLMSTLIQAARVCGRDETKPRTTEVHITSKWVEACDNFRLFRAESKTGIEKDLLVPAAELLSIGSIVPVKMGVTRYKAGGGWFHLKTKGGHMISLRCATGEYPDLTPLLKLKKPQKVRLPSNLGEIIGRAQIMHETAFDAMVSVTIAEGELTLKARKDSGWYRESKKVKYEGASIGFDVNPKFLEEVLHQSRSVMIGGNRMRIESPDSVFCVSLEVPKEKGRAEE